MIEGGMGNKEGWKGTNSSICEIMKNRVFDNVMYTKMKIDTTIVKKKQKKPSRLLIFNAREPPMQAKN